MTPVDFSDDAALVAGLRGGDEAAFAWMLDRYGPPLRRLARSYVSIPSAADEALQETWTAVITGIDRFEGRSSLKTWLYRILINTARTKGVKESRTIPFASLAGDLEGDEPAVGPERFRPPGSAQPGTWAAPPPAWDELPEERFSAGETLDAVRAAVAGLPANQRIVITMRDLDGCTAAEVCNALEISETNQRVLLHRARSKVRAALELHLEGPR